MCRIEYKIYQRETKDRIDLLQFNIQCLYLAGNYIKTILRTENDFYLNDDSSNCNSSFSSSSNSSSSNSRLDSPRNTRNTSNNNNNNNNNSNGGLSPKLQSVNGTATPSNSLNNNNNHNNSSDSNNIVQPIKLMINNCRKSNIYILVSIAITTISSCHDCTIVLGPCCDYIEMSDCSSLTIIALTKGIRIKYVIHQYNTTTTTTNKTYITNNIKRSSTNINVNICTNQKPIISSDCSDIRLAPYNTHYPTLEAQIHQSKIQTNLSSNLWDSPLIFKTPGIPTDSTIDSTSTTTTTTTSSNQHQSNNLDTTSELLKNLNITDNNGNNSNNTSSIYSIIEPDDFYPFSVPFLMKGKTKSNPCELPPKYTKSLASKTNSIQSLHKMIQQSTSDQKIRGHIMHLVESKFQDWLIETDNVRQINDLINMKK
ncbi:tubulin binding cofactor C domain-containing protein [Heterostelium album PN500]|uniref:Tubulin binding cofactor C domain-containing protein n=1 Tax=Heterostelium pallidum (strain ATCC 26659 / Pp 5 / PN500) TaxID=670386 RepID=D3BGA2_HETP5|nr:tubulin binding cofactor C domain-containing protein [Heterostelium album PN500]EFA79502.1 tubulin binding cofactor C domain-containing protein [Heterostelium album PN500]|eukprot:XP_020431623.1 tubulin binding cofactor C domain-containing protein [Heterostelium album PN500]